MAASNLLWLTMLQKPFVIDWVPVFQFLIFTLISTPPNFMCKQAALPNRTDMPPSHLSPLSPGQEFLESTFPATTKTTPAKTSASKEKAGSAGPVAPPALNKRNTLIKFALDQTFGSGVNTIMFSMFMHSIQAAMGHRTTGAEKSAAFLVSKGALDYAQVDWQSVVARSQLEFWPIMQAGWRLWPFVSAFNFAVVKSVEVRNLVGSLAGVGWGVYMSLVAAG